jgi:hypothetical protein
MENTANQVGRIKVVIQGGAEREEVGVTEVTGICGDLLYRRGQGG